MGIGRGEGGPRLRAVDGAGRGLALSVRDHLLAGDREPLPPSVQARLGHSTGRERLGLVSAVVVGFGEAVNALIRGDLIEPEVEEHLLRLVVGSGLRELDFDVDGALTRLSRAAARRELLRGALPAWHVSPKGLVETGPLGIWSVPDAQVLSGPAGPLPASWATWAHSDLALEEGLGQVVDLDGFEPVGRGRLVIESEGLRLDSPERWLHLSLRLVRALDLRGDGIILHADDRRLAVLDGDGWFLAELLRLAKTSASARATG